MSTQYLQVNGGQIAYDITGERGPLVVCAPGMGDVRGQFRFLIPQLVSAGYRVATMDLRGHGESSVGWSEISPASIGSDILALVRAIDAGPAIIVANSVSGGAAVWAAAEGPEWVRALVLLDPSVHGEIKGFFRQVINLLFARPWGPAAWISYYTGLYPTRKPADWAAYTRSLKQNLSQPGRLEALHRLMLTPQTAAAERLGRVHAPVFVLMGSKDKDFKDPTAEAHWVAGQLHGTAEIIEGAGHYPHVEMPEISLPKILAFLKTLQPEGSLEQANR